MWIYFIAFQTLSEKKANQLWLFASRAHVQKELMSKYDISTSAVRNKLNSIILECVIFTIVTSNVKQMVFEALVVLFLLGRSVTSHHTPSPSVDIKQTSIHLVTKPVRPWVCALQKKNAMKYIPNEKLA